MVKYLSIKIVGHDYIVAFENDKKTSVNQPDFKADGVAVWVKTSKPKTEKDIKEDVLSSVEEEAEQEVLL